MNPLKVLDDLAYEVSRCKKCSISEFRSHTVFSAGNYKADLVVVGEGPGEQEDKAGIAFVGPAGKLLDRMLECIGRDRTTAYFCNVVKCRACDVHPTSGWKKNRAPSDQEMENCAPFLYEQIEQLPNKKLLLGVGATAAHWLLGAWPDKTYMKQVRQKLFMSYADVPALITYHPSYLLREDNAAMKSTVWEDLKLAREFLDFKGDAYDFALSRGREILTPAQVLDRSRNDTGFAQHKDKRPIGKLKKAQRDKNTEVLLAL
jgi:uracil-DNA glycosylase